MILIKIIAKYAKIFTSGYSYIQNIIQECGVSVSETEEEKSDKIVSIPRQFHFSFPLLWCIVSLFAFRSRYIPPIACRTLTRIFQACAQEVRSLTMVTIKLSAALTRVKSLKISA